MKRNFNLAAYKPHALGHYSSWIRRFGTTDSYSTQTVFFLLILIIFYLIFYRVNLNIVELNNSMLELTGGLSNVKSPDMSAALQHFKVSRKN